MENKQSLYLVFGGELQEICGNEFANLEALDIVGLFPDYDKAYKAWCAKAQSSVDNALQCYKIVAIKE